MWFVGQIDTPGFAQGVAVEGDYVYIADDESGLRVVNVSDPAHPVEVGSLPMPGYAPFWDVAVQGNYAYIVADWQGGLRVVDVSVPETPTEVGYCGAAVNSRRVAVAANYAYVGGLSNFAVVNVSSPVNPFATGFLTAKSTGVVVVGGSAYVAGEWDGLRVVDVSNPYAPTQAGFLDLPGYAWELDLEGDYAYVANADHGLRVVDVSNPVAPVEVGFWNPGYYGNPNDAVRSVAVAWGHAYVAEQGHGVSMLNVSDPAEPIRAGSYNTSGSAQDVAVDGELVYVADGTGGLVILRAGWEISGKVTDVQGDPISGVTITATGGLTAVTGPAGTYALVDVPTGSYTLTASKAGYAFAPASLEVTVPPNATGQDFVGTRPVWIFLPSVVKNR
jgi:hypothetical protein